MKLEVPYSCRIIILFFLKNSGENMAFGNVDGTVLQGRMHLCTMLPSSRQVGWYPLVTKNCYIHWVKPFPYCGVFLGRHQQEKNKVNDVITMLCWRWADNFVLPGYESLMSEVRIIREVPKKLKVTLYLTIQAAHSSLSYARQPNIVLFFSLGYLFDFVCGSSTSSSLLHVFSEVLLP